MGKKVLMYCEKFYVLASIQNGFIKGKSTVTAIHQFVRNVLRGFESMENVFGLLLDLRHGKSPDFGKAYFLWNSWFRK